MTSSGPLLSIVAVSRNDDHGGDQIHRMQLFVTGLLEQARRHNLSSELVLVEWNPPPDRPRLAQALKWPKEASPCSVRIIEVPPEIHSRFKHSDKLPLFQMIGKNVGIRRARGRFVLATNIDILFSDEIISFFTSGQMTAGHMYRVDRYDVPSDIPDGVSIDEQLNYCREHVIRINTRRGTQILKNGDSIAKLPGKLLIYIHQRVKILIRTSENEDSAAKLLLVYFLHQYHRTKQWLRLEERALHTNACGDFTLMAREHWLALHGYPELEMYSMYIDGLTCYAAHYAGAREVILADPMRVYHIEHSAGFGWKPGFGSEVLVKGLSDAGIPQLEYKQHTAWTAQMRKERQPLIFNDENWGLGQESLREHAIIKADWDKT